MNVETKAAIGEWGMKVIKLGAMACVPLLILILLGGPGGSGHPQDGKRWQTRSYLAGLVTAMRGYSHEYEKWPDGPGMYLALVGNNDRKIAFWDPPARATASDGTPLDAWLRPIIYDGIVDGTPHFHSVGKDGIDQRGAEGSDDIVSWR